MTTIETAYHLLRDIAAQKLLKATNIKAVKLDLNAGQSFSLGSSPAILCAVFFKSAATATELFIGGRNIVLSPNDLAAIDTGSGFNKRIDFLQSIEGTVLASDSVTLYYLTL